MRHPGFAARLSSALLVLLVLLAPMRAARAIVIPWIGPDLGDWNTPANWQDGLIFGLPTAANNEAATISNNTTAILQATASTDIAGLFLGQASGNNGGLRIENGGSLMSIAGATETGALTIGAGGQGNLTIRGGGSLSGTSLSLGGASGSSILLGDTSGLTASLTTTGNATLNRTTQVTGRFVNFNADGNLTLSSTSTLIGQINHATDHSPLKAAGTANVNGTFRAEFTGVTPTAGNTWNIVDAMTINGNFATLDTSAAPALPTGQVYRMRRATGGIHGQLLQLAVQQVLALQVNRSTQEVSIANIGSSPITFDGYSILSSFGALTGSWNSLEDQSVSGWVETPSSANDLNELHPTAGGLTLNGGQSRTLGMPYVQTFPEFGVDPDHLEFEYSTPDGDTFTGVVQYSGTKVHNNFVLNVDPATGQVAFRNDSPFDLPIDGYAIYSASGSLASANWNSLDDQNVTGWEQAPPVPSDTVVSELKADGVTTFQGQTGFSLGQLFKTVGATQDLRFEFLMEGEDIPSEGIVVYGAFTAPLPPTEGLLGDFNEDGSVDAADYVVWRKTDGSPQGYGEWRSNFGRTAGAGSGSAAQQGSSSVPEPSTVYLFVLATCAVSGVTNRLVRRGQICALVPVIAAFLFLGFVAAPASAVVLYLEDFEDTMLAPNTTMDEGEIIGGIASFNDDETGDKAVLNVVQTFDQPVVTFSFDVVEAVAPLGDGTQTELMFRAGIGTGTDSIGSGDDKIELILQRDGGNRNNYLNNGNESIFIVANNSAGLLNITSPVDGAAIQLNNEQTVSFIRNNDDGTFVVARGPENYQVEVGPITRFFIGSGSNIDLDTFSIDNVLVVDEVSFEGANVPTCDLGDVNCDTVVDLANDFETIRLNFRNSPASRAQGDLNGDGLVNFPDFAEWKTAFLSGGGSLEGVDLRFLSVPEPSTLVLAMAAACLLGCREHCKAPGLM